jgi:hypothetical protein
MAVISKQQFRVLSSNLKDLGSQVSLRLLDDNRVVDLWFDPGITPNDSEQLRDLLACTGALNLASLVDKTGTVCVEIESKGPLKLHFGEECPVKPKAMAKPVGEHPPLDWSTKPDPTIDALTPT